MDRNAALRYAQQWAADWNARDLDAVLAHFTDDVEFTSPKALALVGVPTVRGKAALRAYWELALGAVHALRFTLHRILWDAETLELSIVYDRELDGKHDRASEVLQFGRSGKVTRAEVHYGLVPR